jgi:hypothetical protein
MRLRDNLVVASSQTVHHMQKALFEMNVQLSNVISDIVGGTGAHHRGDYRRTKRSNATCRFVQPTD